MNVILFNDRDIISSNPLTIKLSDHRFDHIIKVLKASIGQELKVGKREGLLGSGTIIELEKNFVSIHVKLLSAPPKKLPTTLILALPRPKVFKRVIQTATEIGIEQIYVINSWRVEKSYWQSPFLKETEKYTTVGLEQSVDTISPKINFSKRFKPFVEDIFPNLIIDTQVILAHPNSSLLMPRNINRQPSTVIIGPEGGFIDYEIDLLVKHGATPYNMGRRILRVEHALCSIFSRLY